MDKIGKLLFATAYYTKSFTGKLSVRRWTAWVFLELNCKITEKNIHCLKKLNSEKLYEKEGWFDDALQGLSSMNEDIKVYLGSQIGEGINFC